MNGMYQGKKTKVIDKTRVSAIKNYVEEYILTSTFNVKLVLVSRRPFKSKVVKWFGRQKCCCSQQSSHPNADLFSTGTYE